MKLGFYFIARFSERWSSSRQQSAAAWTAVIMGGPEVRCLLDRDFVGH